MFVLRRGEGIPVLLVHGLGGDHRVWYNVVREGDFKFIAPDLPGHGRSSEDACDDVKEYAGALMDNLKDEISGSILVGLSMGVGVVTSLYIMSPESFRGMLLISGAFRMPELNISKYELCNRIYLRRSLRIMCFKELERVPDRTWISDRKAARYDLFSLIEMIEVPTIFLIGTLDRILTRDLIIESARLARNSKILFHPSSHMLPVENPKAVIEALKMLV